MSGETDIQDYLAKGGKLSTQIQIKKLKSRRHSITGARALLIRSVEKSRRATTCSTISVCAIQVMNL
jgi:hypothetical protein